MIDWIGHAGIDGEFPANSLAGIRAAAQSLGWVEVDVRQCATGEIVLFHDEDLAKITGYDGELSETDWEIVRTLTINDSDERIPRLTDALDVVSDTVGMNLEFKSRGLVEKVAELVSEHGHPFLVSSFDSEIVSSVQDADWDVDTALLFESDPEEKLDRAHELDVTYIHPHYDLCIDSDYVQRAHRTGFSVNTWTIQDEKTARSAIEAGVDGIIIDRRAIARSICESGQL